MSNPSQRHVLGVEYRGTCYSGWQRQNNSNSVQGTLESVLSEIANHPVEITCAGRTDAGVHATSQYIHFDSSSDRPQKAWLMGANSMLPKDISIFYAQVHEVEFHARFSAIDRTYVYCIFNNKEPSALLSGLTTWINYTLDHEAMHTSAQALLGEQNFTSFRSAQCQSHSRHRFVSEISVSRHGDMVIIQITANAFLHHMVRNIVGSLLEVGRGSQNTHWMAELLAAEDRTRAGVTAPPDGLYLCRVRYPDEFQIAEQVKYPLLLSTNFP